MGTDNTAMVMDAVEEAAARSERMPFCTERAAADLERLGRSTRSLDLLIQAGVRESIAILSLECEWLKKCRRPRQ